MNGAMKTLPVMVNTCGGDADVLMSMCGLSQLQSTARARVMYALTSTQHQSVRQ